MESTTVVMWKEDSVDQNYMITFDGQERMSKASYETWMICKKTNSETMSVTLNLDKPVRRCSACGSVIDDSPFPE